MRFEGSFLDGRVNGNGKITYIYSEGPNSRPRSEGLFEGNRMIRREVSTEAVELARQYSKEASRVKLNKSKAKSLPH